MGYDIFTNAPDLGEAHRASLMAQEPLDNPSNNVQLALNPITSGSHNPIKDQNGNTVQGGIQSGPTA